jgi:hypothetical protein
MGPPDADGPRNPVADPHGPGVGALWMGSPEQAQLGGARGFFFPPPEALELLRLGGLVVGLGLACCPAVLLALDKPCGLLGFGLGDEGLYERNTGAAGQQGSGGTARLKLWNENEAKEGDSGREQQKQQ